MPVGFANSSTGEYTGSMFWVLVIRAHRFVVRRG